VEVSHITLTGQCRIDCSSESRNMPSDKLPRVAWLGLGNIGLVRGSLPPTSTHSN